MTQSIPNDNTLRWLEGLPPGYFAVAMASGILSIAFDMIGQNVLAEGLFAATLLGHLVGHKTLPQALELATATLYSLVKATTAGSRDLPLIAEQAQLIEPATRFVAQAV